MKIYVPLNEKGIEEEESCQEIETKNLKIVEFSASDYYYLESVKYFDFLNSECDCIIDLYEDEYINNDKLDNAIDITKILIRNSSEKRFIDLANKILELFELAKYCNTYVNIYCYGGSIGKK